MARFLRSVSGVTFLSALAIAGCAHAPPAGEQPAGEDAQAAAGGISIQEGKLDNGLQVLVLEDHSAPVVTVQVWYRVGARNEQQGLRGMAHLMEHLMFKGSENVAPEDHARVIDAVGGRENAFTSDDVTAYHDTVPAHRMELAVELEAERMGRLKLDPTHYLKEREVVKEELRLRTQNDPFGALLDKFRSVAYTRHPYKYTAIGTMEDLDRMTVDDLRNFYKRYYAPNNAVLVVVGDTTFDRVMKLARKHFGPFAAQEPPPKVTAVEPEQKEFRREEVKYPVQMPLIIGGYKTPAASHEDAAALDVVQMILGGGRSARLHRQLVREKKISPFAGAFHWKMKDPGLFIVLAGYMPMLPSKVVEEALIAEVEKLGKEGPRPEELEKAVNQLSASYIFQLTSIWQVGVAIGQAELVEGDYRNFLEGAKPYRRVTAGDVKRVVNTYLTRERLTMAVLIPAKAEEKVEKASGEEHESDKELASWPTADRFLHPEPAATGPVELPPIARKTLPNGLRLIVIEQHEQPVVYFDLTVPGGNLLDPKGKAGLADLVGTLVTHGTDSRSADEIAAATEGMGGSIRGGAGTESYSVNGKFLAKDFDRALELFADVVLHPTFPAAELGKVRPQIEAMAVRRKKDTPTAMAFEHIQYAIFGYDHPRGRPISEKTLAAVDAADLAPAYQAAFVPNEAILTVAGDLDAEKTLAALEKAFGGWKKGNSAFALPAEPEMAERKVVRLVDKPDLTQSTLAMGHLGIDRKHPDYFKLKLGNWILGGGGFSSRIMKAVRAEGGKTYGAGSWFDTGRSRGPFGAFTFTRNSETGATLKLLLDEIKKIDAEGVTAEELQAAKNNLAGSYVIRLETPEGLANQVAAAAFYGLGEDTVRNYRSLVTAPTREQVNQALARHLEPEKLSIVVVGKAAEVAKQLEPYGRVVTIGFKEPVPDEEREKKEE